MVDLTARLRRAEQAVADVAAAPVRFVPDELLIALLGSWGEPEDLHPALDWSASGR